ncbi:hypothetical protein FHR33_003314 [Nonomuraea dietziae]|uniref:Uncharacterized protein n=1 Tax=Nonomuraea dietziae TaxID=65515 RepID=A0A7W5V251_9ACTN|nr:hypothetical protein [Nonomuraea dietziae]
MTKDQVADEETVSNESGRPQGGQTPGKPGHHSTFHDIAGVLIPQAVRHAWFLSFLSLRGTAGTASIALDVPDARPHKVAGRSVSKQSAIAGVRSAGNTALSPSYAGRGHNGRSSERETARSGESHA